MQSRSWIGFVAWVVVIVLGVSSTAQGQTEPADPIEPATQTEPTDPIEPAAQTDETVKFKDLNDAVPGRFFDAASSAPATAPGALTIAPCAGVPDGNRLIIGFDSGRDPKTWQAKDFRASTAAFSHTTAIDTISFRVVAPRGFYIATITYSQTGAGSMVRTGKVSGGTHWVVGKVAEDLGTFATNPNLWSTRDLIGLNRTSVRVSITSSLFAFSTPALGSASLAITGAEVCVSLLPLTETEPPADGTLVSR